MRTRRKVGLAERLATSLLLLGLPGACHSRPPVTVKPIPSAVVSQHEEKLDPALLTAAIGESDGDAYRLGPGDTLLVAVYGHPELSIAPFVPVAGAAQGNRPVGLLVDNDGSIQLPLIGTVPAAGKTSDELRSMLEDKLGVYLKEPKVAVQVLFAGNIRYYFVGQFTNPGLKYSDRPLRLLEALTLGGTIDLERGSVRSAYIVRQAKRLPVNFRRLILDGDLTQNIRMKSGDVIVVPSRDTEQAFVFGGFAGSDPAGGVVPFVNGRLNLLQALARAGFGFTEHFRGRLSDTRVIRSDGERGDLFVVDAEAQLRGEAAPFELAPGDIVFVPSTALADWGEALNELLPFLQGVAGVLTPFVQIKYLSK